MNKLVILDRDGVINQDSDNFVKNLDEWIPIPGSIEATAKLSRNGFAVAIASNQSGIARGLISETTLQQIHDRLAQLVREAGGEITRIIYCPHGPDDQCDCRKPKPGMFKQLINELGIPQQCWVIGDSLRDLQAGIAVGCSPVLVTTGNGNKTKSDPNLPAGTQIFADLACAADWLISQQDPRLP